MLTKEDIHNLLVFLSRVQLTGNEAETFVSLCLKLKAMEKGEKEESE